MLTDWLNYLENRHSQEIQLGLSRVQVLAHDLSVLPDPEKTLVITVAGTNGKGSTIAALEAIYCAAGYQVAKYTSPHLLHFNERIVVNGISITDVELCNAFTMIESKAQERSEPIALTFFEMATLAALWYFKKHALDVILLEVGMGGRLDATNIVDADLAVITTIDLDHQTWLGETKEAIGYEKAGILRAGKPFVYADTNPPESILNQAKLLQTPMQCLDVTYRFQIKDKSLEIMTQCGENILFPLPKIHLKAAAAALIVSECLQQRLAIEREHQIQAMQTVTIPGRVQCIQGEVNTLLDVAHNPQSVNYLAEFIKQYPSKKKVYAVFSALQDKDLCGLIEPMKSLVDTWYPALLQSKRASSWPQLRQAFAAVDREGSLQETIICYNSPSIAYHAAKKRAKAGDLIVVYGSFLTVAAIMALL